MAHRAAVAIPYFSFHCQAANHGRCFVPQTERFQRIDRCEISYHPRTNRSDRTGWTPCIGVGSDADRRVGGGDSVLDIIDGYMFCQSTEMGRSQGTGRTDRISEGFCCHCCYCGVCGAGCYHSSKKPEDEPWSNLQKWNWPEHEPPCSVSVVTTSEMVARVHLRAMWLPSGQTGVYKPIFQDLFHNWVINVKPTRTASQVIIFIQDARMPLDNIRVEPPENAVMSEPTAGWFSGFEEPSQTPDFYVRTVSFVTLDKPETITIRKPIKSHLGANTINP